MDWRSAASRSAGLRASWTTGERTRACRIHDLVVQSENLANRLCDLIVTHRFDGNFRIELLPVCQGVTQPHEFGLLRCWQFRGLEIVQVIQVCVLQSFPLCSGANQCTQRLMEFFFGVVRSGHDSSPIASVPWTCAFCSKLTRDPTALTA